MRVYLAAMYSLKPEMETYAKELVALGHTCTSSWLEEKHKPTVQMREVEVDLLAQYARRDLQDILASDLMIFFSVDSEKATVRGGRHVEFGYAMGRGIPILVVGPFENIFHHLVEIRRVDTWKDAKMMLESPDSILSQ